jgi:hypothetical protein
VVLLLVVGCTGTIDSSIPPGVPPEQARAVTLWAKKALPVFKAECTSCHDGTMPGVPPAPAYLMGASDLEIRDTILAFMPSLIKLSSPKASPVLGKGSHEGPALSAQGASDILIWINAERDARPPGPVIETPQLTPQPCTAGNPGDVTCPINHIDLSMLGTALPGATLDLVASQVGEDLYLTNMAFKAGADGLYAEHPVFTTYPAAMMPTADPQDRYFAFKVNLTAAGTGPLDTGSTILNGFAVGNPLTVRFDVVDKNRPGM